MFKPTRLKVENLACERGGRVVFSKVSFSLNAGELMELRGPNGAGKSSLLRLLAGLNTPAGGSAIFEGGDPDSSLAEQTHYIGHADANKLSLTVSENTAFWSEFLGSKQILSSLATFNIVALADDQTLLLSAGQKRRLALTRLVLAQRSLWLLDEPTVGLDAASIINLRSVIKKHLSEGGMVVAATHADLGILVTRELTLGQVA
jgi:heme exporter protein A